jgi:hypothetical protein
MTVHIADFDKNEMLCMLATVDIAIYFGEKQAQEFGMKEHEAKQLESLKSAKVKLGAMLDLSSEDMEGVTKAIIEANDGHKE